MTQRLEAIGKEYYDSQYHWDDGSDHGDVTNIYVRGDQEGIQFIKIEYVGTGQVIDESFHGFSSTGFTQMFEIDHLKGEHLISVEGWHNGDVIKSLQFKTNLKVSEMMGYEFSNNKFTLAMNGKKIIGFHGSAQSNLNSLGAYFTKITPNRIEAKGGKGGNEWDDGDNYEALTKIHLRASLKGIENIRFDYVDKDGNPKEGPVHGSSSGGFPLEPFEINHADNEYLLSIDGYYNETSGVIQALQFSTNLKTSELMGSYNDADETIKKFSLGCNGNKIIGFHGYAAKKLNSLGAYFLTLPLTKLEYKDCLKGNLSDPGNSGHLWDDGTFQGVRKVYVYNDGSYIRCVRFKYDNGGKVASREHGSRAVVTVKEEEFILNYPDEFLTSVKGTTTRNFYYPYHSMITSLTFKTSKGRTSPAFGNEVCSNLVEFELERKGCAIVGFHGRSTYGALHALGAYFFPMPPAHNGKNLEEQSGECGLDGV